MKQRGLYRFVLLALSLGLMTASLTSASTGLYLSAKAQIAQVLLHRAWQQSLHNRQPVRPWPWADMQVVARLEVPDQGLSFIVLDNASGEAMAFGPGMLQTGGPAPSPVAISGHRDTHMAFLEHASNRDRLVLHSPDGRQRDYRISRFDILDIRSRQLVLKPGVDALVLTTCYPFNPLHPGGPLRLVVTARQVTSEPHDVQPPVPGDDTHMARKRTVVTTTAVGKNSDGVFPTPRENL